VKVEAMPEISARGFEEAIERALLAGGSDAYPRAESMVSEPRREGGLQLLDVRARGECSARAGRARGKAYG
jgi:hypothetical protein